MTSTPSSESLTASRPNVTIIIHMTIIILINNIHHLGHHKTIVDKLFIQLINNVWAQYEGIIEFSNYRTSNTDKSLASS